MQRARLGKAWRGRRGLQLQALVPCRSREDSEGTSAGPPAKYPGTPAPRACQADQKKSSGRSSDGRQPEEAGGGRRQEEVTAETADHKVIISWRARLMRLKKRGDGILWTHAAIWSLNIPVRYGAAHTIARPAIDGKSSHSKEEIMRLCPNLMLSGSTRFVSTQIFFVKWAPPADWDRRQAGTPLAHSPFPLATMY